jgi:hypothetical protein
MDAPDLPDTYRRADVGEFPLTVVLPAKAGRNKGFVGNSLHHRPG